MADPKIGIDLVANNKTGKGAAAAEKRISEMQRRGTRGAASAARDNERAANRSSRSIIRAFSDAERAGSRIFGNGSGLGGIAGRLGGISQAASGAGAAIGDAAAAGGVLQGAIAGVGVAVGATIGVLVAGAFAAFKLADGWAKGAAAIGRTAEIIGVGTVAMQEFSAAAERAGVDRDKATGSLGSLSQTLNDARYGRNNAAIAMLSRLGVALQKNADGTVNVEAMLPALATAIARQNSSGRRTAAQVLGISLDTLPAFTQGGEALAQDMADSATNTKIITDEDVPLAKRVRRNHIMLSQLKDRGIDNIGRVATQGVDMGETAVIGMFRSAVRNDFKPSAETNKRASEKMDRAADKMGRAIAGAAASGASGLRGGVLNVSQQDIVNLKKTVATEWDKRSVAQGHGIIDTILNRQASGKWGNTIADVVNARNQFSDVNGPVSRRRGRSSVDQIPMSRVDQRTDQLVDAYLQARARGRRSAVGSNLNYANPNFSDRRNLGWINRLDGPVLGQGQSMHRHGTTPDLKRYQPGEYGIALPDGAPVTHKHEIKIYDNRTEVRSSTGGGKPSTSYAFQPVHGG